MSDQTDTTDQAPSTSKAPAPYKPGDPMTLKLTVPLKIASGESKTELRIAMPSMRSFRQFGPILNVFEIEPRDPRKAITATEKRIERRYDFEAVINYLAESTGLSTIELDGLCGADVEAAADALLIMTRVRVAPLV